jgi:mono/diheme cytochrome c family protein
LLVITASMLVLAGAWALVKPDYSAIALGLADVAVADESHIEKGKYLALAGNCASCHTAPGGGFMAGGLAFETPFGTIHSTNITPDTDTGIGSWSAAQFFVSMRHGVRPDGEHLYPVFPYTAFTKLSDDDLLALFAYFRSIPPVRQETPENELSFPFDRRSLLAFWKGMYLDARAFQPDSAQGEDWNRGAYLVEALAHCSACHSPRNVLGAEKSDRAMAGGVYLDKVRSGAVRPWSAPNLTSAAGGLGLWPVEDVAAYLKTGQNAYVETFGPMNEVIMNSTRHLTTADVNAMAVYLKSLPAHEPAASPAVGKSLLGMGRTVYNLHCGTCHLPTGLGDEESAPRLAGGSLVVQASDPASLINVILYGPELPDPPLPTKRRKNMEEFQYLLTDEEVAAVATYVRSNWGNAAGEVTAEQVAAQR